MPAFGVSIHKNGCGSIFFHFSAGCFAGFSQSFFGIVYYELFAKRIDEALGASADEEFVRSQRGELHRIANLVSPQSAGGTNHDGVVASRFNAPYRHYSWVFFPDVFQGNEFIEDSIIHHQFHGRIAGVALQAEESFAGVVGFHVVHLV